MGFFILGKTAFNTLSAHLSVYLFGGHSEMKICSIDFLGVRAFILLFFSVCEIVALIKSFSCIPIS